MQEDSESYSAYLEVDHIIYNTVMSTGKLMLHSKCVMP